MVEREGGVDQAAGKMTRAAVASVVVPGRDHVGIGRNTGSSDPAVGCAPAARGIAATASTSYSRDLYRSLMKLSGVALFGVSARTRTGHRKVEWRIHGDRSVDERPGEMAVAAVTGAVVPAFHQIGTAYSTAGEAAAKGDVVVAAPTADSCGLSRRLSEIGGVCLLSTCAPMITGGHIDRREACVGAIQSRASKMPIAPVPGGVAAAVDDADRQRRSSRRPSTSGVSRSRLPGL